MRISISLRRPAKSLAVIAAGATAAAVFGLANPAFAAAVTVNLSAYSGPTAGGNNITATVSTAQTVPTFVSGAVNIEFQQIGGTTTACTATYAATALVSGASGGVVAAPSFVILSGTKLAITVPAGVILAPTTPPPTSTKYNVCIYNGTVTGSTGSPLIANQPTTSPYTVAAKPTITSITPNGGSSQGGQTVTVVGTNFPSTFVASPANISATIGGSPLTITAVNSAGTSFTAITPPHPAGGPLLVTVTTVGGTANTIGATTNKANLFTYTNGLTVAPITAPNTSTAIGVDVQGVGFSSLTFTTTTGSTPNDANSHVYLVSGSYDPTTTTNATWGTGTKANGENAECSNVLVISDSELVCTMNLTLGLAPNGSSLLASRTVNDASYTATSTGLSSVTANFTSADAGMAVTSVPSTDLGTGNTIASVTNSTTAVLATAAAGTAAGTGVVTIGPHGGTDVSWASGTTTITPGATVVAGDILTPARILSGVGVPPNDSLTATTTLANPTTAASGSVAFVGYQAPVPVGTYTVTVVSDGGVNANSTDPNYSYSVVSSGSTFTVANY